MSDKIRPIAPRPPRYSDKQVDPALTKIAERSLVADPREVARHVPTEAEIKIAQALLAGNTTRPAIRRESGCTDAVVKAALEDPTVCAWIADIVHQNVQHRLGMVDAAMLQRAVNGDTRAASLLYAQYGKTRKVLHGHVHMGVDYGSLTDADLAKIAEAARKEDERVVDVEATDG